MRRRKCLVAATIVAAVIVMASSAWATSVRLVNLAEMVGAAERVFRGRCVAVKKAESRMGLPIVEFTFEVIQGIKGVQTGQTVVFRQVRAARSGTLGIRGVPEYRRGEDLLILLAGDSKSGLTGPIGLGQGVFRLKQERAGLVAVNAVQNRNLALNFQESDSQAMGLTADEHRRLRLGGPLALETLVGAIRKIDRHQHSKVEAQQ